MIMNKKLLSGILVVFIIMVGVYFVIQSQNKPDLSTPELVESAIEDVSYEIDELTIEEGEAGVVIDEMEDLDLDLSTQEAVEATTEDVEKEISEIENEEAKIEETLSGLEDLSF